jgi:hypothetical protein
MILFVGDDKSDSEHPQAQKTRYAVILCNKLTDGKLK